MLHLIPSEQPGSDSLKQVEQSQRRFRLAGLLRRTEEILAHAQHDDWERVEELEKQRHRELVACFTETDPDTSPLVAEALATLLHMNRQITALVEQARDSLVDSQSRQETRRKLVSQYEQDLPQ